MMTQTGLKNSATQTAIPLYGPEGFEGMRRSGQLAAATLDYITPYVQSGVTTESLDRLCEEFIRDHDAIPAPLGYRGFLKATCISVNHVVCHGIPDSQVLNNGDSLNIDIATILDGWYGDTSRMFFVGENSSNMAKKLIDVTYHAMMKGIDQVRPGATLGDIGYAIQSYAESHGFSIVRDFCGHGLGQQFHHQPSVVHYGQPGRGDVLRSGMFFTIEPMINAGRREVKILEDGWTTITKDRSLSAQFEHTIGVTSEGKEIFTLSPAGYTKPPYLI